MSKSPTTRILSSDLELLREIARINKSQGLESRMNHILTPLIRNELKRVKARARRSANES